MQLFSEIYNCYYQIVNEICTMAQEKPITEKEMLSIAARLGFEESGYLIVPRLIDNWHLLEQDGDRYYSKIDNLNDIPLTALQKRWLKAILFEEQTRLFLEEEQITVLNSYLEQVEPLYQADDFYYYDRFQDGDDFSSPEYIAHFRTLMEAIRNKQFVTIRFLSRKESEISHTYLPCRLEYSIKNNKFRLLAIYERASGKQTVEIINLSRIAKLKLTDKFCKEAPNLKEALRASYHKEPVKLLVTTKRNTLERVMLHFANYEKHSRRRDDEYYECDIFYNKSMETELIIELLSFGPTIKVLGPEDFLAKFKERIFRQHVILSANGKYRA